MKKIAKRLIQLTIMNAVDHALASIDITSISKRTKKAIVIASVKISRGAQQDLKKLQNKQKKAEKVKTGKVKSGKKQKKQNLGYSR
ncbi:MAG: hypothetical protein WD824_24840 [Cyclobacteriaceae bacterium]